MVWSIIELELMSVGVNAYHVHGSAENLRVQLKARISGERSQRQKKEKIKEAKALSRHT